LIINIKKYKFPSMDEISKLLESQNEFSYLYFLISLFLTVIYSLIVRYCYENYGNALGSKIFISRIIVFLAITTFLVISVVKQSLALSLGLVGALSIIRFRTAIKEAEQIVYFLVLTSISIACAANSFLFPVVLVLFIFAYTAFNSNQRNKKVYSVNDQIIIKSKDISNHVVERLVDLLNSKGITVNIQSINKQEDSVVVVLKLSDFNLESMTYIEEFLKESKVLKPEIQFFSSSE